ncbi:MAG: hypothetical protein ACM3SS_20815 [Rhodospirillaceae bacterium]
MIRRFFSALLACACTALPVTASSADAAPSYGQELAQVYGTYQAVVARREACNEALPGMKANTEKSYTAWRNRNAKTVAELDERLGRMIRGASKDDKEYARNIGKYEGAMLQQRNDVKRALLAQPREELDALCKTLPDFLSSKESDLESLYAEELKSIRSRR